MALSFLDNVDYRGKKPNFTRDLFPTIAEMANFNENYLPDVFIAVCAEDGKAYVFNRSNTASTTYGKWRPITSDPASEGKLSADLIANANVGFIKEGTTFAEGTTFEELFISLLKGKTFTDDQFYYGVSDTREITSLYQFTESTSAKCLITANNQYIIFAVQKDLGNLNIQDVNGWNYNSDYDVNEITHNGILYNIYVGKYQITATNLEYRLSIN